MPQGERTEDEKKEFKMTLNVINMLYLGARVQILLDFSYINRFWTQFEAWVRAAPREASTIFRLTI